MKRNRTPNPLQILPPANLLRNRIRDLLIEAKKLEVLLVAAEEVEQIQEEPASPLGIERQMLEAGGKALASPFNEAGKMLEPAMSKVSKAMELSKAIPNDEGANS